VNSQQHREKKSKRVVQPGSKSLRATSCGIESLFENNPEKHANTATPQKRSRKKRTLRRERRAQPRLSHLSPARVARRSTGRASTRSRRTPLWCATNRESTNQTIRAIDILRGANTFQRLHHDAARGDGIDACFALPLRFVGRHLVVVIVVVVVRRRQLRRRRRRFRSRFDDCKRHWKLKQFRNGKRNNKSHRRHKCSRHAMTDNAMHAANNRTRERQNTRSLSTTNVSHLSRERHCRRSLRIYKWRTMNSINNRLSKNCRVVCRRCTVRTSDERNERIAAAERCAKVRKQMRAARTRVAHKS
jgi:hypothetical protein